MTGWTVNPATLFIGMVVHTDADIVQALYRSVDRMSGIGRILARLGCERKIRERRQQTTRIVRPLDAARDRTLEEKLKTDDDGDFTSWIDALLRLLMTLPGSASTSTDQPNRCSSDGAWILCQWGGEGCRHLIDAFFAHGAFCE